MDAMQWLAVRIDPVERYMARRSPPRIKGRPGRGRLTYPASAPLSREGADRSASPQTAPWLQEEADEIEAEFFGGYRSILERHSAILAATATELIERGRTTLATDRGEMDAQLIRFWNGSAVIDLRMEGGSSISRISRRERRNQIADLVVGNLALALAEAQAEPIID